MKIKTYHWLFLAFFVALFSTSCRIPIGTPDYCEFCGFTAGQRVRVEYPPGSGRSQITLTARIPSGLQSPSACVFPPKWRNSANQLTCSGVNAYAVNYLTLYTASPNIIDVNFPPSHIMVTGADSKFRTNKGTVKIQYVSNDGTVESEITPTVLDANTLQVNTPDLSQAFDGADLLEVVLIKTDGTREILGAAQITITGRPPDADGDGFITIEAGGNDCNDNDSFIYPREPGCIRNGQDNNCDGVIDQDAWPCPGF